jgi:hypothetical protein
VAGLIWPLFLVKNTELVLAVVGTGLQAFLCLLLLNRRSYREFPIFFSFATLSTLATIILWGVSNNAHFYGNIYWANEALGLVLAFFALQEAFRSVFRNFLRMRWFRWLFPGIGLLMSSIAVLRLIFVPRPAHSLFTTTIIALEVGVGFLQFGIFSLFIVLIKTFHLRWRQHSVGIVFGFGISAAGSLVAYLLRSEFGTNFDPLVNIAAPLSYIIGVVVWLVTFLKSEPSQLTKDWDSLLTPEQMISELRRHTNAVKGILGR